MQDQLAAAGTAFAVVFLAEMGDKSQLVLLAQAARQRPARVLAEALAALGILAAVSASIGAAVARVVPDWLAAVVSGLLFLAFGLLAAREARQAQDDARVDRPARRPGGTFALVLVSELGDKTMLATAALAASSGHAVATGIGAFAGEALACVLGVMAGAWLGRRLPERWRPVLAAAVFLVAGSATLAWGLWLLLS